jgi:hypothetical protein
MANYQYALRNIPEEWRSQSRRSGRLTSRKSYLFSERKPKVRKFATGSINGNEKQEN